MKKKINTIAQILAVIFFTLGIVIDFFPDIGISLPIAATGVVLFLVVAVITHERKAPVFLSSKQEFVFTFLFGIYIFSLLFILEILGGVSQVGIGFNSLVLWGLYLFGLLFSYIKYKREKSR
ncbi:hypothetical protein [Oceanobacillus sp. CAU 1775]